MSDDGDEVDTLLQQARQGNGQAVDRLLSLHRDYLRRLVDVRLDGRLRARLDASDVVQLALIEATRRMPDFLAREPMPFRLWLRQMAYERLIDLHRQHAAAECRAVGRDQPLPASSMLLAHAVLNRTMSPERQVEQRELVDRVRQAVAELPEPDAEIILLRNFEDLSNVEAARVLEIEPAAASKRYGRALLKLRKRLASAGLDAETGPGAGHG